MPTTGEKIIYRERLLVAGPSSTNAVIERQALLLVARPGV